MVVPRRAALSFNDLYSSSLSVIVTRATCAPMEVACDLTYSHQHISNRQLRRSVSTGGKSLDRFDSEKRGLVGVGQYVDQPVWALPDVADALPKLG